MTTPWQTAPPVMRGLKPYLGCLALVAVGGYHDNINDGFKIGPAVRVTLVILDGPEAGSVLEDQVFTYSRMVSRLRTLSGSAVLGRIVGEPLPGGKTLFDLADPTPADQQTAIGWHNAFPGRLDSLIKAAVATWEAEENKGRGRSLPATTPPAQQWAGQPAQQPAQPAWTGQPAGQPVQQTWPNGGSQTVAATPDTTTWNQHQPTNPPWAAQPAVDQPPY